METQSENLLSRLDNLTFSKWHLILVIGIGTVWFFDGYEVSLIVQLSPYIIDNYSETSFKSLATIYSLGCIIGSVFFGIFSYYKGRRLIFIITLLIYALGVFLCILSYFPAFVIGRLLTGISVGGQFTAVFTAIDQFLPPAVRGRVDIIVDSSWHLGGVLAAVLNMLIGHTTFWRGFFIIGAIGALGLICLRRNLPQSPRWLLSKGRRGEAERIIENIQLSVNAGNMAEEEEVQEEADMEQITQKMTQKQSNSQNGQSNQDVDPEGQTSLLWSEFKEIAQKYKRRIFLSCYLIFTQAFFMNHFFFSYPVILKQKYGLNQSQIGSFLLPIYLCAFISTIFMGPLFDKVGRKIMLFVTYMMSGLIFIIVHLLDTNQAVTLQIFMVLMFFFTSPASSSANLIASQIFPTRSRPIILSLIFILSMVGGMCGIWVKSWWISSILMMFGGVIGIWLCPNAQNKSLESINDFKNEND